MLRFLVFVLAPEVAGLLGAGLVMWPWFMDAEMKRKRDVIAASRRGGGAADAIDEAALRDATNALIQYSDRQYAMMRYGAGCLVASFALKMIALAVP